MERQLTIETAAGFVCVCVCFSFNEDVSHTQKALNAGALNAVHLGSFARRVLERVHQDPRRVGFSAGCGCELLVSSHDYCWLLAHFGC